MEIPSTVSGRQVTPRGVHLLPFGFHNTWMQNADYWCNLLVSMGMSWVVVLTESDNFRTSGAAEALLDAGIIPIVRPSYKLPRLWTFQDETVQLVNLYAQYGAPLIVQFANEPFDPREWKNEQVPPYEEAWAWIVQRWHEMRSLTVARGAYAGFPDGPSYSENLFLRIGDDDGHWAAGRAVYLGHHYGLGRPLDYPEDDVSKYGTQLTWDEYLDALDDLADDPGWNEGPGVLAMMNEQREGRKNPNLTPLNDDTCWRGWEKVLWYSQVAFGFEVQIAMTEGGWTPRARAGDDIRWPYTTPKKVADFTLAMYNYPSPLFAICPWILASDDMGGSGWYDDCWHGGAYSDKYGSKKPVIQKLIDNPPGGGGVADELNQAHEGTVAIDSHLAAALALLGG